MRGINEPNCSLKIEYTVLKYETAMRSESEVCRHDLFFWDKSHYRLVSEQQSESDNQNNPVGRD